MWAFEVENRERFRCEAGKGPASNVLKKIYRGSTRINTHQLFSAKSFQKKYDLPFLFVSVDHISRERKKFKGRAVPMELIQRRAVLAPTQERWEFSHQEHLHPKWIFVASCCQNFGVN